MRALVHEVQTIGELTDSPGWKLLLGKIRQKKDSFLLDIAKAMMRGDVVDQRQIDFERGYYQGALETVERPEKAWENLEGAARRAWFATQMELLSEEEELSPYA